jgi:short-subunit dehydrogenase
MQKAIIIGATSGIGMETAKILAANGYIVGMAGRREERLAELQKSIDGQSYFKRIDVSNTEEAVQLFNELVCEMGGLDVVVICSGIVRPNYELDWQKEKETVDTNVLGFMAMANAAARIFLQQKHGHLVGISSNSALVYSDRSNAYCASKAFVSSYLRGLRISLSKASDENYVTEALPGWVYTEMTQDADQSKLFWVTTAEKAAGQIFNAILKKKRKIYISKRWRLLAWCINMLPERLRIK